MRPDLLNQQIMQRYQQMSKNSLQKAMDTLKSTAKGAVNVLSQTPLGSQVYQGIGQIIANQIFGTTQPGNTPPVTQIF